MPVLEYKLEVRSVPGSINNNRILFLHKALLDLSHGSRCMSVGLATYKRLFGRNGPHSGFDDMEDASSRLSRIDGISF